jgi:hypothetical protein
MIVQARRSARTATTRARQMSAPEVTSTGETTNANPPLPFPSAITAAYATSSATATPKAARRTSSLAKACELMTREAGTPDSSARVAFP